MAMKQSHLLIKLALVASLAACASSLPEAPGATGSQTTAEGPQELPSALRRSGYDAPDYGNALPPELAQGTSEIPSRAAYLTEGARAAGTATEEIPNAPNQVRGSYQPRADLSQFDPQLVTEGRAPRAPIEVRPQQPAPMAASSAAPKPDEFSGRTQSVMANATPTEPRAVVSGQYGIHLASYRNPANVTKGWDILRRQHADMLGGLQARGASVTLPGKGDFVRLIAGPFATPGDARALCAHLRSLDEYCKVMPFDGVPVL
ncbi:MAG: SPOR domain-containing protein [Parvularcula sp.]